MLLKSFSNTFLTILFADSLVAFSEEFQNISIPATCIIPLHFNLPGVVKTASPNFKKPNFWTSSNGFKPDLSLIAGREGHS